MRVEEPALEIIQFAAEDVITTSPSESRPNYEGPDL